MTAGRADTAPHTSTGVVVAVLVLAVCVTMPVASGTAAASGSSEGAARAMLARMNAAEQQTSYEGLRFVSAWTAVGATSLLIKVRHVPGRGSVVRVMGRAGHQTSVRYERRSRQGQGLEYRLGGTLQLLVDNYQLAVVGNDAAAGRNADVVEARRDDGSVAARFWLDRQTGLLLRREVRDRQGRVVRASAFVKLEMGALTSMEGSSTALPQPWRRQLRPSDLESMRAVGWTLPRALPGGYALVEARRGVVNGREVVHLSYSDGLFMVSLFVQQGSLAVQRLDHWRKAELEGCCVVYRQHTIPRRAVWSGGDHVYTLVADAPPDVVRQVVTALPHSGPASGFLGRMMRGLGQLGTWLNPFG